MKITQTPSPRDFLLKWQGDILEVTLKVAGAPKGHAAFRTNLGHAGTRRKEIIAETDRGITPSAKAWHDIPLDEKKPGVYSARIPLNQIGIFSGKACFFPAGSDIPLWPEGENCHIKVESAETRSRNSIYTVFPRQFGSFREVIRRLPHIMDTLGFRCVQTLPPFPVPTTYAVMGKMGCPFAALDFMSVDPALAEFDTSATPLDQFRELIDAVHAKDGLFFVDLPANHTGWASTLQTLCPEWFKHNPDGSFASPGAWGVVWADLVALNYENNPALRSYMARVFLFWCRLGVDGFRCDAGYMIPAETWTYIVARVREEFPDTVFMLEGLGGELKVTDRLLTESGLDWAYSEIFQTYTRDQFEAYLPAALTRSEKYGTLVHFAETHDNDRLAKGGEVYARLRVQLAALLSAQGAWGIVNGVEWYCTEKIDVHDKNGLNWGAEENMIPLIAKLNAILTTDPTFTGACHLKLITRGGGNTLAVQRGTSRLILANLDCAQPAEVDWERGDFAPKNAEDKLTGRLFDATKPITLAPGEVLYLRDKDKKEQQIVPFHAKSAAESAFTHWVYPRDTRRDVVVLSEKTLEVAAPVPFRGTIVDPESSKTLRAFKAALMAEHPERKYARVIPVPKYEGGDSRCRALTLNLTTFEADGVKHTSSKLLIPPTSHYTYIETGCPAHDFVADPLRRTILSNGAGAAAQLRLGWGQIASQYDAILAANPDPHCPSDRLTVWTRTRCWVQREGYVREVNAQTLTKFDAEPEGRAAKWRFDVPCGMGRVVTLTFEGSLAQGFNAARLKVTREAYDGLGSVRLVFRPDIEWRSFHTTTKAYTGPEKAFPAACTPTADGVRFHPYEGAFTLSVRGGTYHHEPQWTYNVPHPEEAARGQEPAGDLFSPGWISADIEEDGEVILCGEVTGVGPVRSAAEPLVWGEADYPGFSSALLFEEGLRRAMNLFIVKRDDLKTVIAGYPWFLDWGRDTFIFMRGMIAAGMWADSLAILKAFAAFEEHGTLPNIIYGKTAGNRDTSDAQLFFILCVKELAAHGSKACKPKDLAHLKETCHNIVANYKVGTPNGIHMDEASGLIWSPAHFTWMDTNYPACTPRVGYPVEIQALWVAALDFLGEKKLAKKARESIKKYFLRPAGGAWDCLAAPNAEPAAAAVPEDTIRPNMLFLVTLGVIEDASIVRQAEELLIPGGIRTLSPASPLYKGVYAGDEDTARKPAYHNGTAWAWPFPLYAEALVQMGLATNDEARQILLSALENLNTGCFCHMSECADGDAPHAQKACTAQAWSVSELLRVWLKVAPMPRLNSPLTGRGLRDRGL